MISRLAYPINRFVLNRFINQNVRYLKTSPILRSKEFTDSEEWLLHTPEYTKIGLTKNAVEQLGELVFIDYLNEPGDSLEKGEESVTIESVKAVNGIILPFDCKIVENNEAHLDDLDNLNENPECEENSWIIKVKKE